MLTAPLYDCRVVSDIALQPLVRVELARADCSSTTLEKANGVAMFQEQMVLFPKSFYNCFRRKLLQEKVVSGANAIVSRPKSGPVAGDISSRK